MDKMSNFFDGLKERLNNPFILSFLISWCIWNYKIVVALVFYKQNDLQRDGFKSYLDLIDKVGDTCHFLVIPFSGAIIFTAAFPFIKNGVLWFGALTDTWGGSWIRKASKKREIPVARYLEMEAEYNAAMDKVIDYTSAESAFKTKELELRQEVAEIELSRTTALVSFEAERHEFINQISNWSTKVSRVGSFSSPLRFNGDWKMVKAIQPSFIDTENYRVEVYGDTIAVINKEDMKDNYDIELFVGTEFLLVLFLKQQGVNNPHKHWKINFDQFQNVQKSYDDEGNQLYFTKQGIA